MNSLAAYLSYHYLQKKPKLYRSVKQISNSKTYWHLVAALWLRLRRPFTKNATAAWRWFFSWNWVDFGKLKDLPVIDFVFFFSEVCYVMCSIFYVYHSMFVVFSVLYYRFIPQRRGSLKDTPFLTGKAPNECFWRFFVFLMYSMSQINYENNSKSI